MYQSNNRLLGTRRVYSTQVQRESRRGQPITALDGPKEEWLQVRGRRQVNQVRRGSHDHLDAVRKQQVN